MAHDTDPQRRSSDGCSPLAVSLAAALDHRLQATVERPLWLGEARMYGCTVNDARALTALVDDRDITAPGPDDTDRAAALDGLGALLPVRFTFLGAAPVVYDLIDEPMSVLVRAFDAAVAVCTGWGAPLNDDGTADALPRQHPDRFRLMVCTAVCDEGIGSVMRTAERPDEAQRMTCRGSGVLPDALELLWFGRVLGAGEDADDPVVRLRTPASDARRHRRRCR